MTMFTQRIMSGQISPPPPPHVLKVRGPPSPTPCKRNPERNHFVTKSRVAEDRFSGAIATRCWVEDGGEKEEDGGRDESCHGSHLCSQWR